VASKDGAYDGYLKFLIKNLHVFVWEKERKKDILHILWDGVVGLVTTVLKNPNGNFATKVPISGNIGKSQVGTWQAIGSVLENAFFKAMLPKLDEKITVEKVQKKMREKVKKRAVKKALGAGAAPASSKGKTKVL
jgi:hypothetical protein